MTRDLAVVSSNFIFIFPDAGEKYLTVYFGAPTDLYIVLYTHRARYDIQTLLRVSQISQHVSNKLMDISCLLWRHVINVFRI